MRLNSATRCRFAPDPAPSAEDRPLTPATRDDLIQAIQHGMLFDGRKRTHHWDGFNARIAAEKLVDYLKQAKFRGDAGTAGAGAWSAAERTREADGVAMPRSAQQTLAKPVSSQKASARRTPEIIAIERLAKLAVTGTKVGRMVITADTIVSEWRAEPISPRELRDRIETLRTDVEAGLEAAEAYVVDAESDGQKKATQNLVDGLRAVQQALHRELERA